jgi:leucyl aminopeptidase
MLKISFNDTKPSKGVAVLCLSEGNRFSPFGQGVDMSVQGALGRGLQAASFQGKSGQTASFLATGSFERLVALGLGEARDRTHSPLAEAGGSLVAHLLGGPHTCVTVVADELPPEAVVSLAFGALLRGWRFDKYRTRLKDSQKIALREVSFSVSHPEEVARAFAPYQALAESVLWARSMIAEPANVIYPQTFVEQMESFRPLGLTVETLNRDQMKALGMGALLGVAQGSALEPLMGIVHWKGGAPGDAPVAFVGKGVTFDSGGLSLKPASAMEEMKGDMGGAAAVIAVMRTLAARGAKVNAVGVVALVENMPSGTAQRPGDIVTSMSGQTIEVLNTDAEGRLILADALHYTCQQFKPRYLVDLATLTGAMKVALGSVYGGLFSPHDGLSQQL